MTQCRRQGTVASASSWPAGLSPSRPSWLPQPHPPRAGVPRGLTSRPGDPHVETQSILHPELIGTLRTTSSEKPVFSSQAENQVGAKSKQPQHQFYTNKDTQESQAV